MRYRKDVHEMVSYAKKHGFSEEGMTGSGHWKMRHTSGEVLILSATPSGTRWRRNVRATIDKITRKGASE